MRSHKPPSGHTKAARRHAKRRAAERYGMALNRRDILAMLDQIHAGASRLLLKQSNTRSIYLVSYRNRDWIAVYSTTARTILTFLTWQQYLSLKARGLEEDQHEQSLSMDV